MVWLLSKSKDKDNNDAASPTLEDVIIEEDKYRSPEDDDSSGGPPPPPPDRPPPSINDDEETSLLLRHTPRSPSSSHGTLSQILNDEASQGVGSTNAVAPPENITTTTASPAEEAATAPNVAANTADPEKAVREATEDDATAEDDETRNPTIEVTPEGVILEMNDRRRRRRKRRERVEKELTPFVKRRPRTACCYSGFIVLVVMVVVVTLAVGFATKAFTHGRTNGNASSVQMNQPSAPAPSPTAPNPTTQNTRPVTKVVPAPTAITPTAPMPTVITPTAPTPTAITPTAPTPTAVIPTASSATAQPSVTLSRNQAVASYITSLGSQYGVPSAVTTQALTWLLNQDPLQLTTATTVEKQRLEQRYALLTLWYSSTSFWNQETNWLNATDECTWYGITCGSGRRLRQSGRHLAASFRPINSIQMAQNNMRGPLPPAWGALTSLKTLGLSNNTFYGGVPPSWNALTNLQALFLDLNRLNGTLPSTLIGNNPGLEALHLGENNFDASPIPSEVYSLTSLVELVLSGLQITGTISNAIGSLTALKILDLSSNAIKGSLPSTIGALSSLQVLDVEFNYMSGALPESIGSMSSLQILWLSFNRVDSIKATGFTGTLPTTIGLLGQLTDLELVDNSFSGPMPSELGNLSNLRYLHAQENKFSGTIPTEFQKLTKLLSFNTTANTGMSGKLPSGLCFVSSLVALAVDCAVTCTCCAACS